MFSILYVRRDLQSGAIFAIQTYIILAPKAAVHDKNWLLLRTRSDLATRCFLSVTAAGK